MGKMQREKGKRNERECARELRAVTGHDFQRVLREVRDGNVGDVRSSSCPIVVQVKSGQNPPIRRALQEALEAAQEGEWAIAKIKKDRQGSLAVMRWSDLMLLLHIMAERTDGRLRL